MKINVLLTTAVVVLSGLLFFNLAGNSGDYLDSRCFANTSYVDATDETALKFTGNVNYEFTPQSAGVFVLTGILFYQGNRYIFSRHVTFHYKNVTRNKYRITLVEKEPLAHDNTPEDIADLAIKILGLSSDYYIFLQEHDNNTITIGTPLSPSLNCVINT